MSDYPCVTLRHLIKLPVIEKLLLRHLRQNYVCRKSFCKEHVSRALFMLWSIFETVPFAKTAQRP